MTSTPTENDVLVLDPAALSHLDAREFARLSGEVNSAFTAARHAYDIAEGNLAALLTEQVCRRIQSEHPTAALMFVPGVAEYHFTEDGDIVDGCAGHGERLKPGKVYDAEGMLLTEIDDLHPSVYLMERLSPILGTEDYVLDVPAREWSLDCSAA
jgi:hypothetical protein